MDLEGGKGGREEREGGEGRGGKWREGEGSGGEEGGESLAIGYRTKKSLQLPVGGENTVLQIMHNQLNLTVLRKAWKDSDYTVIITSMDCEFPLSVAQLEAQLPN